MEAIRHWENLAFAQIFPSQSCAIGWSRKTSEIFSASRHAIFKNAFQSTENQFTYVAQSAPGFLPTYGPANVSLEKFLGSGDTSSQPRQPYYYYYSGNVMNEEFDQLRDAIRPDCFLEQRDVYANVWIGSPGVHATPHYDSVFNVYVQLSGVKTFVVAPPRDIVKAHVFGRFHPNACQSRFLSLWNGGIPMETTFSLLHQRHQNWKGPDRTNQDLGGAESQMFFLQPGDVLFLPPYWLHETFANTTSMSVSFWWDAKQWDIMDEVYGFPVPVESVWEFDRLEATCFAYLILIANKISTGLSSTAAASPHCEEGSFRYTQKVADAKSNNVSCKKWKNLVVSLAERRYQEDKDEVVVDANVLSLVQELISDEAIGRAATSPALSFLKMMFLYTENSTSVEYEVNADLNSNFNVIDGEYEKVHEDLMTIMGVKFLDYAEDTFEGVLRKPNATGSVVQNLYHPSASLQKWVKIIAEVIVP